MKKAIVAVVLAMVTLHAHSTEVMLAGGAYLCDDPKQPKVKMALFIQGDKFSQHDGIMINGKLQLVLIKLGRYDLYRDGDLSLTIAHWYDALTKEAFHVRNSTDTREFLYKIKRTSTGFDLIDDGTMDAKGNTYDKITPEGTRQCKLVSPANDPDVLKQFSDVPERDFDRLPAK